MHLLRKILTRLRGTNFCTSSARFAPSFVTRPNCPKCTQTSRNAPELVSRIQWLGSGAFVAKNSDATSWHEFCTSSARFAPSFVRQPHGPECTQKVRNAPNINLESNGVDRVRSLRKIPTRLRGTNFCTSLASFAPSFVRQPNGPECTPMVRNTPKRQFRVQWSGLGAIIVKNSYTTSWHEHLH